MAKKEKLHIIDIDKEILTLIDLGKKKGSLSYDEVEEAIAEKQLSTEEIDDLFIKISKLGINIGSTTDEISISEEDADLENDEYIDSVEIDDTLDIKDNIVNIKDVDNYDSETESFFDKEEKDTEEEVEPEYKSNDSIKLYLSEMGRVPLLSRDEEIEIAKRIKDNEKKLQTIVLRSPITLKEIKHWESLLKDDEMTPKELMNRGKKKDEVWQDMRDKMEELAELIRE